MDATPPSSGLRHLPGLADRAQASGLTVDRCDVRIDAPLSSGLELTVYRIVQEALTNAAKHAPGAHVAIHVSADGSHVEAEVTNDAGAGPTASFTGGGHGLTGMRERVRLYNGALTIGPEPAGGFAVRARLPIDAPVPGPASASR
jgi:signal transduction histidine kinase